MVLWTVQPRELYEEIMITGKYTFDRTMDPMRNDFERAYLWLENRMASAGIVRKNPEDPLVWAWHTYAGSNEHPQTDNPDVWSDTRDEVMIEVEVPDDQILLSDFDSWHCVLNHWYCESALNEDDADREHNWFGLLSPEKQEAEMKKSWERIFDITKFDNGWACRGYYVQATFFGLTKDQIKNVFEKPEGLSEKKNDE